MRGTGRKPRLAASRGSTANANGCRHARQSDRRKIFPQQTAILALRGPKFSYTAVLRRYTPAHFVFDGRGRLRLPAWTKGRLSFRPGRGDHRFERPTGEVVPAARLPRRGGSLRRLWILSAVNERRSGIAGHTAGPEVVRPDQVWSWRRGGDGYHRQFRPGENASGVPTSGNARISVRLAGYY